MGHLKKSVRNSHNFYASWNIGFPKWHKFWSTRTFGGSPTRPMLMRWQNLNEFVSAEMDWSYEWAWQVLIVKVELLVFWRVHLKVLLLLLYITYIKGRRDEKWSLPWIRVSRQPFVHPSNCPCESTPWKLWGCRLHTIPLRSLTLQLLPTKNGKEIKHILKDVAHQEWEGNKPGMALHPCPYLDTSSSSMCCLLDGA
jgi:hypothetical protein